MSRPATGAKHWWGTFMCFLRGHNWVGLFCPEDETLHPWCPRCEEWRA